MFHRPPRPEDNVHNIICGKGIKVSFENKSNRPHLKKLGHPVSLFFLSLTFFFRLIPEKESMEAPCVHLSAQVSKT